MKPHTVAAIPLLPCVPCMIAYIECHTTLQNTSPFYYLIQCTKDEKTITQNIQYNPLVENIGIVLRHAQGIKKQFGRYPMKSSQGNWQLVVVKIPGFVPAICRKVLKPKPY